MTVRCIHCGGLIELRPEGGVICTTCEKKKKEDEVNGSINKITSNF